MNLDNLLLSGIFESHLPSPLCKRGGEGTFHLNWPGDLANSSLFKLNCRFWIWNLFPLFRQSVSLKVIMVNACPLQVRWLLLGIKQFSNTVNADEFGLFYQCLPNKSYNFKGKNCSGREKSKVKLTRIAAGNTTG